MNDLFKTYVELLTANVGEEMSFKDISLDACKRAMSKYIDEHSTDMNEDTFEVLAGFTKCCSDLTEFVEIMLGNNEKSGFCTDIVIPEIKDIL